MERLRAWPGLVTEWWTAQTTVVRSGILGVVAVVLVVVIALQAFGGESSEPAEVVARTPSPAATAAPPTATATASSTGVGGTSTASRTRTPTPTPNAHPNSDANRNGGAETPEPTETPGPTIGSIAELVEKHGHPAGYTYARIRIPKLGIDAPVGASPVDGSQMAIPEGPATVLWYDLSGWSGLGGIPGEGKNAIFGGHVDVAAYLPYAEANYFGAGVFKTINQLVAGDRIFVDFEGEALEYRVTWNRVIPAATGDWVSIWSSDVPVDSITVYTCGGEWNVGEQSYRDRIVLRAERV